MRQNNLRARVAPSILAELRTMASEQGVSVNQLVNLALGQFVALHREPGMAARAERAVGDPSARVRALATLDGLGTGEPLPGDGWDGSDMTRLDRRAS